MQGCNRCGHIWDNCECTDKEVIGADRDMFEVSVCEHELDDHSFLGCALCRKCGEYINRKTGEVLPTIEDKEVNDLGPHYKQGSIQPIEVIADMGYKIPFCLGNAIKYIMRCEHKDNMKEDLQKAINYLNIIIEDENNG